MKKLLGLISGTTILLTLTIPVLAQNRNSCFMLDGDGNAIDLGHLCQKNNSASPRGTARRSVPRQTQSVNKAGVYVIPIKGRSYGVPIVEVQFNREHTFDMLLDTGASGVYVSQEMARKLDINYTGSQRISTASNIIVVPKGRVYSVGVGEMRQRNVEVATLPSMDMGLLGQSFFGNYDMTIKSDVVEFRAR